MSTDDRGTHDHDHDHEHPGTTPDVNETGYYELMAEAMKELLIEKGVVSADDVRRNLEFLDSRDPVDGGRVITELSVIMFDLEETELRSGGNGTVTISAVGRPPGCPRIHNYG